jgi:hypothetical protein
MDQKKFSINFPLSRYYNCFRHGKKTQTDVDGILSREKINESLFPKNLLLSSVTIRLAGKL